MDREIFQCGNGLKQNQSFVYFVDQEGKKLEPTQLESFEITEAGMTSVSLTERGCLNFGPNKKYLVRNIQGDQSTIFASDNIFDKNYLDLKDHSKLFVGFNCKADSPITVNDALSVKDLVRTNIPDEWISGFEIFYSVDGKDLNYQATGFQLNSAQAETPIFNSEMEEKPYRLSIRVKNNLRRSLQLEESCTINLDKSFPSISLEINQSAKPQTFDYLGNRNILSVKSTHTLSFRSESADLKNVEYCLVKLSDETSTILQPEPSNIQCNNPSITESLVSLAFPEHSGFWSIIYRAID
ncbi:MAG: hypothetical protein EOO43_22335, partial [Flavobacterium sp.]